jgi:hypothetical protein
LRQLFVLAHAITTLVNADRPFAAAMLTSRRSGGSQLLPADRSLRPREANGRALARRWIDPRSPAVRLDPPRCRLIRYSRWARRERPNTCHALVMLDGVPMPLSAMHSSTRRIVVGEIRRPRPGGRVLIAS